MHDPCDLEITRRDLLKVGAVSAAAVAVPPVAKGQTPIAQPLHPMQAAFVKHDGYQCGYCTLSER